jgi:hypothetical protein
MVENLVGKMVRHFKGDLYLVLAVGRHTETEEKMVAYKALYGEGKIWFRPSELFMSKVPEGKENPTGQKYRFEMIEPKRQSEYELGD